MKVLIVGGTRFVGRSLVASLLASGHEVSLFTRGIQPVPSDVDHIKGDRNSNESLEKLKGRRFEAIVDTSGRKQQDTEKVLSYTGKPLHRFLYVSSAGVYADSQELPIDENYKLDPLSRHSGKAETEDWLIKQNIPFTSFRPTYIYGPGNYNPIETWFFDRIVNERPIPLPANCSFLTQLGHVNDLAEAMTKSLSLDVAENRIYNCSGDKGVTFLGLAQTAALACGLDPGQIDIRYFDQKILNPKARKSFPLRIGHFYTDISRIKNDLDWNPNYNLLSGLLDSFKNDFSNKTNHKPDFSSDDVLLGK